jgi:hypothetical protein
LFYGGVLIPICPNIVIITKKVKLIGKISCRIKIIKEAKIIPKIKKAPAKTGACLAV